MPRQGSPSPASRPQLDQRQSSTQSITKGSPTAGHLSKSHSKGSSTRLHKAHAAGHGRHPHAKVPSYGKGLHKLSKLGPGEFGDGAGTVRQQAGSASSTPSGSPSSQKFKRNSSNVSLPRTGSKVSMKKNTSDISFTRNVSATKLGNHSRSEKAHTKNHLRENGADDAPLRGQVSFEVGDEGQDRDRDQEEDDDWTEDNSSQSPNTFRQSSTHSKSSLSRGPPSLDEEPPNPSPQHVPHSPPKSPPTGHSELANHTKENGHTNGHTNGSLYFLPSNAEEVTSRLLKRKSHNVTPMTSSISATITPSVSSGSPAFYRPPSHTSSVAPEPSMPADGISRFLSGTGSKSGSVTPNSVSHLHSNLGLLNYTPHRPSSPALSETASSRRVRSAVHLTYPRRTDSSSTSSTSPPKQPGKDPTHHAYPRTSPYESARGLDPSAGKSLTQLKLDLQRMNAQKDEILSSQNPLMQNSTMMGIHYLGPGSGSSEVAARLARQYQQARAEYRNGRRFYPDLIVGGVTRRSLEKKIEAARKDGKIGDLAKKPRSKTPGGSESSGERVGRGKFRFELGQSPGEGLTTEDGAESHESEGGVEGLLKRMWMGGELVGGGEE